MPSSEEFLTNIPGQEEHLIAYRLLLVENTLKENNTKSIERDDKLFTKLDVITGITERVGLLEFRVEIADTKFNRLIQYVGAMSLVLLGAIASFLFQLFQK